MILRYKKKMRNFNQIIIQNTFWAQMEDAIKEWKQILLWTNCY